MPINSSELLSVVAQLTEDRHVRATVRESLKGGCIAATTTVVGGLLLGPAGLAVGGIVGGCTAALISKGKFKPVSEVIMNDMTNAQRERLAASVAAVVADLRVEDVVLLLPLLLNNPGPWSLLGLLVAQDEGAVICCHDRNHCHTHTPSHDAGPNLQKHNLLALCGHVCH